MIVQVNVARNRTVVDSDWLVVKTSVTVNNSSIQDYMYVHPNDRAQPTYDSVLCWGKLP